jgi:hypothetical protein
MASGQTLITFEPAAYQPPPGGFAVPDLYQNDLPGLLFRALVESAHFTATLPRHYGGGGIIARACWIATTGTPGPEFVYFSIAVERHDPTWTPNTFAAAAWTQTPAIAALGTIMYVDFPVMTGAYLDGLVAGEHFRIKIQREGGAFTGNMLLVGVELREG